MAAPGRPQEIQVAASGQKPFVLQQITTSFAPSNGGLRAFAGEYASVELQGTYTIAVRDSGLVIQIPGRAEIVLRPVFCDAFTGTRIGLVRFSPDAGGAVTGFAIFTSGVRGLPFYRRKAS